MLSHILSAFPPQSATFKSISLRADDSAIDYWPLYGLEREVRQRQSHHYALEVLRSSLSAWAVGGGAVRWGPF